MAWVLSIIGLVMAVAGGGWVLLIVATDVMPTTGLAIYTMFYAAAPGASLFGSGLIFMAFGAGLFRLAQIHDEAKAISDQLDRVADYVVSQPGDAR